MRNTADSGFDPKLAWVVQGASALSLGTLAALVYSVRTVNPQIEFRLSAATFAAFALAAVASIVFWHLVFRLSAAPELQNGPGSNRRLWVTLLAFGFIAGLVGAFAYPLKGFSHEKVSQIAYGTVIAFAFLTVLGLLFWRVVRYLEQDR